MLVTVPSALRLAVSTLLVAAIASWGMAPAKAEGIARLGMATFDSASSVVSVPFKGPAPHATLYKLSPSHFYYELQPARLAFGGVQFQAIGGAIQRFTLADRPAPDVVRLSFQLTGAAEPVLRVDGQHHRLIVLPLGHEVSMPLARTHVPKGWKLPYGVPHGLKMPVAEAPAADLERPFLGDHPRRFVLPFRGPLPRFVATAYQRNPHWILMDLYGADARPVGGRSGAFRDPLYEAWMLSRRPEPHHIRLYLRLRRVANVSARVAPNHREIWLSAEPVTRPETGHGGVPAGHPTAAPKGPTPAPAATRRPTPSATPRAVPSATPRPTPSATPRPTPSATPRAASPAPTPDARMPTGHPVEPLVLPGEPVLPTTTPAPMRSPAAGTSSGTDATPSMPPLLVPRPDSAI